MNNKNFNMGYATPTEEEMEVLYNTLDQFEIIGKTDTRCPRCGKKLLYKGNQSAFEIKCEDPTCIRLAERGI